jgi:hypothetical protein
MISGSSKQKAEPLSPAFRSLMPMKWDLLLKFPLTPIYTDIIITCQPCLI